MGKETLGDYQVVKQLGESALGEHLLAEHRFLKRPFSLKVLPEELISEKGFVQRFEKKVAELALLDHPHIVKLQNVSSFEGRYFLVSDPSHAEMTLAHYLAERKTPLKEQEVLKVLEQVANALEYIHQKKMGDEPLFHGALTLNNLLVTKGKAGVTVSVDEIGLSSIIGSRLFLNRTYLALTQALLQHESSVWHSFAFLSPEQKEGEMGGVKADVYAFGVLAYVLLMQKFPDGYFPLPSQAGVEYKRKWDALICRCLSPDPHKRPDSLSAVLEEVREQKKEKEGPKPLLKPAEITRPEFDADPGAIFQKELTVGKFQPKPVEESKTAEPLPSEMVVIQGGTFYRGSNHGGRDEMPRHAVVLNSFAIDIHPVTNEQFARFLEAMGGEKDASNNDIIRLRESRIKRSGGKLNIETGYGKHPVVGVTWYGAVAYAKWVGKRLPTEAEWEIAACGGLEDALFPTGKNIERAQANFFSSDTTAVMSYPPNGYGLYDMAGNVYEWCSDWYEYHYYDISVQEPNSPKGPAQGVYRVVRGGCWKSLKEDMRCSHRHRNNPGTMNGTYGFRCASGVKG